jgi:hypothetical protein
MHHHSPNGGRHELIAEWASIAELEPRFGISKSMAYRLIAAKLIEAKKVGARTSVNLASVRRYYHCQPAPAIKQDDRSVKLATATFGAPPSVDTDLT